MGAHIARAPEYGATVYKARWSSKDYRWSSHPYSRVGLRELGASRLGHVAIQRSGTHGVDQCSHHLAEWGDNSVGPFHTLSMLDRHAVYRATRYRDDG